MRVFCRETISKLTRGGKEGYNRICEILIIKKSGVAVYGFSQTDMGGD